MLVLKLVVVLRCLSLKKFDYTIIVDSREQRPLFTKNIIKKGLKTGDYSFVFEEKDYSDIVVFERKSVTDIVGTLTRGHERFSRELERARSIKHFFIIVDESYYKLRTLTFKGSEYLNKKKLSYTVATVRKIVQTLRVKYGVQIIFCDTRTESKLVIKELIEAFLRTFGQVKQKRVKGE